MPSEQPKDGGPAFPHPGFNDGYNQPMLPVVGMSLRDWFAGQAMAALIGTDFDDMVPCNVSWQAWEYADAMLAARDKS